LGDALEEEIKSLDEAPLCPRRRCKNEPLIVTLRADESDKVYAMSLRREG
jgi:hypothetical protein